MKTIGLTVASLAISLLAAGPLHAQQPDPLALLRPTPASVPDHNCVICGPTTPLYTPPPDSPYPLALLPLPPASGPPVKNCTFCHGPFAQGLAVAPRLAGQRAAYIEKELRAFRTQSRDNPFSSLYMWNAVPNMHPETARALADFFSHEAPRRPTTAIARWSTRVTRFSIAATPTPISSPASPATARMRRA